MGCRERCLSSSRGLSCSRGLGAQAVCAADQVATWHLLTAGPVGSSSPRRARGARRELPGQESHTFGFPRLLPILYS